MCIGCRSSQTEKLDSDGNARYVSNPKGRQFQLKKIVADSISWFWGFTIRFLEIYNRNGEVKLHDHNQLQCSRNSFHKWCKGRDVMEVEVLNIPF